MQSPRSPLPALAGLLALGVLTPARGQISVTGVALSYTQNFNSLNNTPNSGLFAWADNSTLANWYAGASGTFDNQYMVSQGNLIDARLTSFGSAAAADRALGSLSGGDANNWAYGVRFRNDSQWAQQVSVGYTGEQWRRAATGTVGNEGGPPVPGVDDVPHTMTVAYRVFAGAITSPSPGTSDGGGGWVAVSGLQFNAPQLRTGPGGALDGNAAANREVFALQSVVGLLVQPNQEIFIRWRDPNFSPGFVHGLAVDDVQVNFTAIPEAGTSAALGLAALGLLGAAGGRWRR
jgi:hypothetical protein